MEAFQKKNTRSIGFVESMPWGKIFVSQRRITTKDTIFEIFCKIIKSTTGKPVFVCEVFKKSNVEDEENDCLKQPYLVVRSLTATGVVRHLFLKLNIKSKKKWPGSCFYGLSLHLYREKLNNLTTVNTERSIINDENVNTGNTLEGIFNNDGPSKELEVINGASFTSG